MDDATMLSLGEVERVKTEIKRASRRVEKSAINLAEAQKRVSEIKTGLTSLAGSDTRTEETFKNLLQQAKRESERRQKERHLALSEL